MTLTISIEPIYHAAFNCPREPRSPEYKNGVRAALQFRFNRKIIICPHELGSALADAFFYGLDEGHRIWRTIQSTKYDGCIDTNDVPVVTPGEIKTEGARE